MAKYSSDCRYFANGICSKGNTCSFVHDLATRNEYICQFNLAGKCSYGQACRFIHTRPQSSRPQNQIPSTSSSSSTSSPAARVRPVRLAQPGLNADAAVFVPRWLENSGEKAPPLSYAAAAASSNPDGPSCSSYDAPGVETMLCPYYQKNGECNRMETDCIFVHGDKCDMCMQWCLHPNDEELRKEHQMECLELHTSEMERAFLIQKTESKSCGICMENISEKNLRFGILNNCQHCFCLECIRQWRSHDQRSVELNTKTVRSCPECRQHSDYVIPSLFWVEGGQEKELLIRMYKENTKSKVCKYYSSQTKSRGNCPFGNKCFYKHQLPDGSIDPGESPHVRRKARLSDFLFEDDSSNDGSDAEVDDLLMRDIEAHEREDFQSYLDEMSSGSDQGEFYRSITNFIRSLHRQ